MLENLPQLVILFFVITDPIASFTVFIAATLTMDARDKMRTALLAVGVAVSLSLVVLVAGDLILKLFSTKIEEFKIAGGIILVILGIKMTMGKPLADLETMKNNQGRAIASIIGTPLITGPATITAILVSVNDYGRFTTGTALGVVFLFTALLFLAANRVHRIVGSTAIQMVTTFLGLITVSWGVKYIAEGIQVVFSL